MFACSCCACIQGQKDCIGKDLAEIQGLAFVAMFVGRFEVALSPPLGTAADVIAKEKILLTLQPGDGMWLKLKQR